MRMIITTLFVLINLIAFGQNDPVLFTVADDPVHVSEFKYIYEKNNASNADYSKASIDEYLELYKKFKLKVRRAKDLGLDTVKVLQDELAGYRKQLAKSYLKDKEISERLVLEVIERMKQDVEVSHIFISCPPKSGEAREADALTKIEDIHSKLKSNKGKFFGEMAKTLSEDKISSKRGGRLGYYTAPLPDGFYEFENAMYETEVGQFSDPIRSKMGYHIVHVKNKRPARGQLEIAHILLRKKHETRSEADAQILIDSIYGLLDQDRNFENMAGKFSEDDKTKGKGGYLGFFGVNQYELTFENAAFGLENDNDYSKPIETSIGYHIIKRLSKRDDSDIDKLKKRVEARIRNQDRFSIAEGKLIDDVKEEAGFKEDKMMFKRFSTALNQDFYSYKWESPEYDDNLVLFELDNQKYSLNDFGQFAKTNIRERLKFSKSKPLDESAEEIYDLFIKEKVLAYEENNLENKYPDFKSLMQEYREGILLFEITKQEVWDKASKDTTGLNQFYKTNASNYMWPERVKLYKYSVDTDNNQKVINLYKQAKKKDHLKLMEKYLEDQDIKLTYKEVVLEKTDEAIAELEMTKDAITTLALNPPPASFYRFIDTIKPTKKSLSEAKGYVIADYQDYLETEWINNLKKQYKIDVNKKVLNSLIK